MARLGLALCFLWVAVYVHAAPGNDAGRDTNHDGETSTHEGQRKLASVPHPIAQINKDDSKHADYGTGDKTTSNGGNHGEKSDNSGDGDGRKDSDGSRVENHSSNGDSKDGAKGYQGGASISNENGNHNSGSDYGSSLGGANGGGDNNFGKVDKDKIVSDAVKEYTGQSGGHGDDSGVKGQGPSGFGTKGDTDLLEVSGGKSGKEEMESGGHDTSGNKGSDTGARSSNNGGINDEKGAKGGIADNASVIGVPEDNKDFGDKKEDTIGSHTGENVGGGYHNNTSGDRGEKQDNNHEEVDPSPLSAGGNGGGKNDHGTEKATGGNHGGTGKEGGHHDSSGHGTINLEEKKDQGGEGDSNNEKVHENGGGKQTPEPNNYGGSNYGSDHGGYNSGSHGGKSEGQDSSKDRLAGFSDRKIGYGG